MPSTQVEAMLSESVARGHRPIVIYSSFEDAHTVSDIVRNALRQPPETRTPEWKLSYDSSSEPSNRTGIGANRILFRHEFP